MKIKKYEGKSEQEVMQRVKDELGLSAVILSIKRKPYRGLLAFFRRPLVVITAAYEEKTAQEKLLDERTAVQLNARTFLQAQLQAQAAQKKAPTAPALTEKNAAGKPVAQAPLPGAKADGTGSTEKVLKDVRLSDQQQRIASLENKLNLTEELLSKAFTQLNAAERMATRNNAYRYDNEIIQNVYETMVRQGVVPEIAEKILESLDVIDEREQIDVSLIVKIVYNVIADILGEPSIITIDPGMTELQVVAFMGPTGVGKTTTIAKLSSILALNHNVRVGLITADTYRIAAVEQLKTYAGILGLDVQVVYNNDDIENNLDMLRPMNDVILLDTAGRSHRNEENLIELRDLLDMIPNCRRYLVLSAATKYEDMLSIVNTYSTIADFDLLFTKLDETSTWGSILNICYLSGKRVSYVTFGQNVPDDIEVLQPEKIIKTILGLEKGDYSQPSSQPNNVAGIRRGGEY